MASLEELKFDLFTKVHMGQLEVSLVDSDKYACYWCRYHIDNDVILLKETNYVKGRQSLTFYPMHNDCYEEIIYSHFRKNNLN